MAPQDEMTQPAHKWSWVWIVLAVLLAAVTVGSLWWWKTTSQSPVAACNVKDLSLSIGAIEQSTNIRYAHAVLTNNGKTSCTLSGYPTVSALDKDGANYVVSTAQTDPFYPETMVTLSPKGQAYAAVGLPDASRFEADECTPETVSLRLYLPAAAITATSVSLSTPFAQKVCPGFSVTTIQPGA